MNNHNINALFVLLCTKKNDDGKVQHNNHFEYEERVHVDIKIYIEKLVTFLNKKFIVNSFFKNNNKT